RPSSSSTTTTCASVLEPRLMVKAPAIGQVSVATRNDSLCMNVGGLDRREVDGEYDGRGRLRSRAQRTSRKAGHRLSDMRLAAADARPTPSFGGRTWTTHLCSRP